MKHSHFSPAKGRGAKGRSFARPGAFANQSHGRAQDPGGAWAGKPKTGKPSFGKQSKRWPDARRDEGRNDTRGEGRGEGRTEGRSAWPGKPSFGKKPHHRSDSNRDETVKDSGRRHTRARDAREQGRQWAGKPAYDGKSSYMRRADAREDNRGKDVREQSGAWVKPAYGKPAFGKKPHYRDDNRPDDVPREKPKGWAQPAFAKNSFGKKDHRRPPANEMQPLSLEAEKAARGDTAMLWGMHAVREAWLNPKRRCFRLWITESAEKNFTTTMDEAKELLLKRPDVKKVERHELDRITPPGSVHQGIVLEADPLHEPMLRDIIGGDQPPDLILMLDQVTDPHNVGAILRSAAAFGAGAVVMTERNAPGTTGVLAKAASGTAEHVPQIHVVNLARALDELQEAGYWRVGLAEEGEKHIADLDLSGRTVLVLGAEGEGLRQLTRKKCDELAKLPTGGPIGSLNVSNAAAVALYEVRRQKKG